MSWSSSQFSRVIHQDIWSNSDSQKCKKSFLKWKTFPQSNEALKIWFRQKLSCGRRKKWFEGLFCSKVRMASKWRTPSSHASSTCNGILDKWLKLNKVHNSRIVLSPRVSSDFIWRSEEEEVIAIKECRGGKNWNRVSINKLRRVFGHQGGGNNDGIEWDWRSYTGKVGGIIPWEWNFTS